VRTPTSSPTPTRLRPRALLPGLVLLGAAGGDPLPGPAYAPHAPAPTGLGVSLRSTAPPAGAAGRDAAITAAGDTVVAAALLSASGCGDYRAHAGVAGGVAGGALVVTVVDSLTERLGTLAAVQATFRAVVYPAPRGRYPVEFRTRVVPPRRAPIERVLAREFVTVPR
jgi:hypothetical protein